MNNHQPFTTVGEQGYLDLLQHILDNGYQSNQERTGTGTLVSPTPHQLHFPDVAKNFPLFTTKYVSFNMLACEMLWFISGSTNAYKLAKLGSEAMKNTWFKWADKYGELGPIYGEQMRKWKGFVSIHEDGGIPYRPVLYDQLQDAIDTIKNDPESRRIIVSHWNVSELGKMALPPCHLMYQFTCEPVSLMDRQNQVIREQYKGITDVQDYQAEITKKAKTEIPQYRLHLHMLQRSCDMLLGVPFNVAQYALLLLMVSQVTNTIPGGFTWTGVNCHIYQNHISTVKQQLSREPYNSPEVALDKNVEDIDDFTIDDIHLIGYKHHPKIQAEVSV